ncbi:MAG: DNA repair protein RecO [Parcubacteria group bacterium CG1_02_39_15]|uniref:DNA repair protein RecO n=4 Tax=Candidatus Nealsoniibacteriota TaxID=1817911 RepID=A0A2G9YTB1_9BACT|nr:MAG: DNA repair protein RecO [Parcubacteria group bacterium CG1_02_39_15]PIP22466.1 MAG: DNA repair protein RecO [Candidatus Nealsonbacteria bacterium CG23_combo_of_CG06-09_8_20_14_all_39_25]PIQ98562.1 MAG: DNA repair protein RecO [Candidatus Nealsonbacteria bacterium CG11_big_fil_rev_8_21_14_0_20_39_9]PIW89876.1 MAG: DNA repair protein RecO [Candidatus Nealsonbacteria bacterium CG_4_8_14_3_um_filter_40_11]PIZ88163.1 MAG: DNA repair protein RecO [Candidatus Nealsonbacteria bacterium CG_4_10_
MFIHYRTQGLIFKKEDLGETNQLFTIYTKDFGKLEILGKAIRKISSKLKSGAELFYLSEIEFIQGKTHKTLTDAILIENFPNIKKDLKRLKIAYQIVDALDNMVKGQEPDEKIWQLLNETFERLNANTLKPVTCNLVYYYFLWNFLAILGYQPELYHCSLCQKKISPEKVYFSSKEGGLICRKCFSETGAPSRLGKEIQPETIKIIRLMLQKDWKTLLKLKIEAKYLKELFLVSKSYFSKICGENSLSS